MIGLVILTSSPNTIFNTSISLVQGWSFSNFNNKIFQIGIPVNLFTNTNIKQQITNIQTKISCV